MKCNGFDSDDYRYFYLETKQQWSGFTNHSYGKLEENEIFKLSKYDLVCRLFSSNYDKLLEDIHEHKIVEYPTEKPFDLNEYIHMQEPITFKNNGTLGFVYEYGEYIYINRWMSKKMNSTSRTKRLLKEGTIREENLKVINMIRDDEKIKQFNSYIALEDSSLEKKELPQQFYNQAFRFRVDTKFEIEYYEGETWVLVDSSIFLSLFNQDFIRLLANSKEILDKEKEEVFLQEYKDNIPGLKRRYYRVKDGITVERISHIVDELSLKHFGVEFESLNLIMNAYMVNTCRFNRDNYNLDGSVKYFYIDYMDNFNDRIAEKEILKISVRVSKEEALKIHEKNLKAIEEKEKFDEAVEYIRKNKSSYKKFCHKKTGATPIEFVEEKKKQLVKKLIKTLNSRKSTID